ncbi:MAG TPA: LLM class flavin-dependent oxidoreductase [Rhizomicrobium sp.]|jgi:pyrimidine oxygenase|nr:LLM class flavin-dependent oxidoreductase [Rhizomicrobium sp.]
MSGEFGVFLPVASGGWIVSRNTPLLDGGWAQNRDAALIAEEEGLDFVMSMGKWRGFGGATDHWGTSLESVTMMAGIAALTKRVKVWATLHAILHNPVVAAKMIATLDHISGGRAGLNIVAGAYRGEFEQMDAWDASLDHDARYDLTEEWTQIVKRLWKEPRVDFEGRFFTIKDCVSEPKPLRRPDLICAGMSARGFDFSVREADICFIGGRDEAETREASLRAKDLAAKLGKTIKTYAMCTVIYGGSDKTAEALAESYCAGLDEGAVLGMLASYGVDLAGKDNAMVARAKGAFMTHTVIGAPRTCAQKIAAFLQGCALDGLMLVFADYAEGLRVAGREILPLLKAS